MDGGRKPLPPGTRIKLPYGSLYEIAGEPIGFGGCSILYPARRLIGETGQEQPDGILYALKECFPAPSRHTFCRNADGSVVPKAPDPAAWEYLHLMQKNMAKEIRVANEIFHKANYILPILESAEAFTLTLPGGSPCDRNNVIALMHSIHQKGMPLHEWLKIHKRLKPAAAFRILQQLLFALREIHLSGFLHLDIKPSNIFLRGALEEGIEILTLMDLGSAMPLADRQAGIPLSVTEGFCPPEVSESSRRILAEMGTVLPGPSENGYASPGVEADLYQAACLLRYLLTGRSVSSADLLLCPRDQYLRPREAARLKCSATITERIQRLLTRGLAPDPRERYHSAEEMLQDVNAVLDVLSSKSVSLGSVKYDAFICYKHGPVDSVVARKLQQMLEHYRAPRIKDLPRKPFRRVFVDEGELSSCPDMGREIDHALKNSAHLIVLCSPDTPNSPWVDQEIRAFRDHHKNDPKAKILPVLTGGTPETSYPSALMDSPSADPYSPHVQGSHPWHVLYKLRRGEFLKVVAPMLDTVTADDLLQRQKRYRRRRAAAAAVFLSIACVISVSRSLLISRQAARIRQEHTAAQRSAGLYLTEQARLLLEDRDRLGALELLLEAFPDPEFPPAPQTQYQLSRALGTYISPNQSEEVFTDTGSIQPAHNNFFPDLSGDYLFTWNPASETIDIWNTGTMTHHCTVTVPLVTVEQHMQRAVGYTSLTFLLNPGAYACETSEDFLLPESKTLIYRGRGQVSGLDYAAGADRWSVSMDNTVTMAINESRSHLLVLSATDEAALTAHLLEAETGRILGSIPFTKDPAWVVSAGMQLSDDLRWAAIPVAEAEPADLYFPRNRLYLLDLETGESRLLQPEEGRIAALKFAEDRLLMQIYDNYTLTTVNYSGAEVSRVPDTQAFLSAWDPASGTLLWQQKLPCYSWDPYDHGIHAVPYDTGTCTGRGILFYWERAVLLADPDTGETIRAYSLPDGILDLKTGPNNWCATLRDGTEVMGSYDSETLYRNKLVPDTLTGARSRNRVFYLRHEDGRIVRYEENRFDQNYESRCYLEDSLWQLYDVRPETDGYRLLLMDSARVAVVHTHEQEVLYHDVPDHYGLYPQSALGLSEDGRLLYWCNIADDRAAYVLYSLDLENGKITESDLPFSDREVSWWDPVRLDGRIVYAAMEFTEGAQNKMTIYSWTPGSDRAEVLHQSSLPGELDALQWDTFLADPENNACFLAVSQAAQLRPDTLLRLDVRRKTMTEIPVRFLPELPNTDALSAALQAGAWHSGGYCWSSDGKMAVICFGDTAYCTDRSGAVLCQIPLAHAVVAACICPGDESLLLAEEDGTISRWRLPDGMWMGSVALKDYCAVKTLAAGLFRWEFTGSSTLAVYTGSEALLLELSDDSLAVSACVNDAQLLDEEDQFWLLEPLNSGYRIRIGTFPRYTADDLKHMAQAALS